MTIQESLKTLQKTLDDHQGMKRWLLSRAIDRVAAELGYEFTANGILVCNKPDKY